MQIVVAEVTPETLRMEGYVRDIKKCGMAPLPLTVLVNPTVCVLGDRTATHREGCLSLAGFSAHVPRPLSVLVRACSPLHPALLT